jgi:hypothetical protein
MTMNPIKIRLVTRAALAQSDPFSQIINVKDSPYNAQGDGITNDGAAIQAALDAAYGALTNPVSNAGTHRWQNRGVYIPAGIYLVDQPLLLAPLAGYTSDTFNCAGAYVFGDGQRNTRLVYTGPVDNTYGLTSLMTGFYNNYSSIRGIGFDVTSSNAICAVHISDVAPGGGSPSSGVGYFGSNGGSGVSWIDCAFIGATGFGVLSDTAGEGSEQQFIGCLFDSCTGADSGLMDKTGRHIGGALHAGSANALNITVIGCRFSNNNCALVSQAGSIDLVKGCVFHNNAYIDMWIKQQNSPVIVGCRSDSPTFACVGPAWIAGCTHITASQGLFFDGTATFFDQDNPIITIEGCYSSNSRLDANSGCVVYLRGNTFDRGDATTNWAGTIHRETASD